MMPPMTGVTMTIHPSDSAVRWRNRGPTMKEERLVNIDELVERECHEPGDQSDASRETRHEHHANCAGWENTEAGCTEAGCVDGTASVVMSGLSFAFLPAEAVSVGVVLRCIRRRNAATRLELRCAIRCDVQGQFFKNMLALWSEREQHFTPVALRALAVDASTRSSRLISSTAL